MKKILLKSKLFIAVLTVLFTCFNTNSNAQFNLGNFDLNSLLALESQISNVGNLQDSILNVVQTTLNDSTIIDQDSLADLQNQLTTISNQQDSLQKVLADSTGLTQDSIATLLNQVSTLQNQQDSLQQVITDANVVNIDSLNQLATKLLVLQNQFDSLSTIATKQMNNISTLNQDTINKYSSTFTYMQLQVDSILNNNQVQGVEINNTIQASLYPNPSSLYFSISTDAIIENVSIKSINGIEVISFSNQEKYNVSSIESGLYIVLVKTNKGYSMIKLNKE